MIYSDSRLIATHKKIDGYHQAQVDIFHYLETLEKKPGALKNSKALKSRAELKTIYDTYFINRTREFIDILRKNQDKNYPRLLEILEERGNLPAAFQESDTVDENVASNTREQLKQLSSMFMRGGSGYVN